MKNITSNFNDVEFDAVTIDFLENIANTFYTVTTHGEEINNRSYQDYSSDDVIEPLLKTHQDPFRICYTKKFHYEQNLGLNYDYLEINPTELSETWLNLDVYVHKGGQLIRQLGKPAFSLNNIALYAIFKDDDHNNASYISYNIDFRIDLVEVLRKRPSGRVPCNASLLDEDSQWRNVIMNEVGCVPAFWKRFVPNESFHSIPLDCNQEQYLKIDYIMKPIINFENGSNLYMNSCTHMTSTVTTTSNELRAETDGEYKMLKLKFLYSRDYYKEIVNNRAYTRETLLSQVGGFIGKQH